MSPLPATARHGYQIGDSDAATVPQHDRDDNVVDFMALLDDGVSSRLVHVGSPCDAHPCLNEALCEVIGLEPNVTSLPSSSSSSSPSPLSTFRCLCGPFHVGDRCEHNVFSLCSEAGCAPGTASCSWAGQQNFSCPTNRLLSQSPDRLQSIDASSITLPEQPILFRSTTSSNWSTASSSESIALLVLVVLLILALGTLLFGRSATCYLNIDRDARYSLTAAEDEDRDEDDGDDDDVDPVFGRLKSSSTKLSELQSQSETVSNA